MDTLRVKPSELDWDSLIDQHEELLERLYFTNRHLCQVVLDAAEKLKNRGEYIGEAKLEMQARYREHASNVRSILAMLGYEPNVDESYERLFE